MTQSSYQGGPVEFPFIGDPVTQGLAVTAAIAVLVILIRYLASREKQNIEIISGFRETMRTIQVEDQQARTALADMFERSLGRVVDGQRDATQQMTAQLVAIVESNNRVEHRISEVLTAFERSRS